MNWISTVEPAPWRIAGFELGPLLFGHCMLIERFDLRELADEDDLHFFLGVCSRTYADARKWLTEQSSQPKSKFKDFAKHRAEALAYLHENMALPQTLENVEGGATLGTPFLQGLRLTAISNLNYNPEAINNARFGQLVWDVLSYRETHGQTRVIDSYLAEQLEKLGKMNAKV
jgi:hypothetical protein